MIDKVKQYAKFIAAVLGAIAASFAGLIPAEWAPWLQAVIALATAVSVLAIPNQPTNAQISGYLGIPVHTPYGDGEGIFE